MRATRDEFMNLPEGTLAEYIGGEILVSPSPKTRHQRIVQRILKALDNFVEAQGHGEVFVAPYDVHLPSGDVVQPDVLFVSAARSAIVQDWVRGAPDLVVEVLSPETRGRDLDVKSALYAQNGVAEAWFVDPDGGTVEIRRPDGIVRFEARGTLVSFLLPGFELPLAPVFAP